MPTVPANEIHIYYTEQGAGLPVVLLHAGTATGQMWDRTSAILARHFRVIVPDLRAHGRTDNPSGEFRYRLLADDAAALCAALAFERPFVLDFLLRHSAPATAG